MSMEPWKKAVLEEFPLAAEVMEMGSFRHACSENRKLLLQQEGPAFVGDNDNDNSENEHDIEIVGGEDVNGGSQTVGESVAVIHFPILVDNLRRVAETYFQRLTRDARVGPELFIMAQSDRGVCLAKPGSISWAVCRDFLRSLPGEGDERCVRSFWSDAGISKYTVQDLRTVISRFICCNFKRFV